MRIMKKIYTLLCIAATMLAACAKENIAGSGETTPQDEEVKYIDVTFGAEFPVPAELQGNAKTMLNSDLTVSWCEGDQVAVNNNGWTSLTKGMDLDTFTGTVNPDDPHKAIFSGKINSTATKFIAVYPAADVKLGSLAFDAGVNSNGLIYMILPNEQTAKEGSFTNGCALSYAIGDVTDGNIPETAEFSNLCATLEFTMPDYVIGAKSVNIKSNDGTKMSGGCVLDRGTVTIGFKSFGPSDHFGRAVYDNVTVTAPETASKFYAVILPGSYSNGLTITVTTENDRTYSRVWGADEVKEFQAGHIYNLGVLGVVLDEEKVSASVDIEQDLSTGSIATLNMTVSDALKDMVTKWIVELCDKNGVAVRKSEITDGNLSNIKMDVTPGHTLIPAGDYTIKVSYNMPSGSTRKISTDFPAEAPHFNVIVKDLKAESNLAYSNNVLTGTDIKVTSFTVDVLPEIAAKIEWVNFNLKDADGTLYRTSTKLNEVMTVQNSLPYLPNDTYKLTTGFRLTELGDTDIAETAPFDVTVAHTPTFGVELTSAKTSYDYYKAGGADNINKANACHNMGIYELAAQATGISSAVATQMAGKFSYEWFLDGTSLGKTENADMTVSGGDRNTDGKIAVDFGSKKVSCTATFEGGSANGTKDVAITGLPYSYEFPNDKNKVENEGWIGSGSYGKGGYQYYIADEEKGGSIKKMFYIPSDINISANFKIKYYATKVDDKMTTYVDSVNSSTTSTSSSPNEGNTHNSLTETGSFTRTSEHTFTESAPYLMIYGIRTYHKTGGLYVPAISHKIWIYNTKISYK